MWPFWLDSIAVSVFVLFYLSLTNQKQETKNSDCKTGWLVYFWRLNQIPFCFGDQCLEPEASWELPFDVFSHQIHSTTKCSSFKKRGVINQKGSKIFSRQNNYWRLLAWFTNSERFYSLKHNGVVRLSGTVRHPPLAQHDKGSQQKGIMFPEKVAKCTILLSIVFSTKRDHIPGKVAKCTTILSIVFSTKTDHIPQGKKSQNAQSYCQ